MAVTLEWISDHYDANKNRYIEKEEAIISLNHRLAGTITVEEYEAVQAVYVMHTLLPVTLEWIRDHYDKNNDCVIDDSEVDDAFNDVQAGNITDAEFDKVVEAFESQTYLCVETPAKGKIVYPNYPTTAIVGASITVECRVKNTGGSSGTFKLALYKGTARITQTSTWNQGAGTTTGIKRLNTTVPSTGTNVSYVLKCIRVT